MKHPEIEIIWIAEGIRGMLLAKNDTDNFPEDFYKQAKALVGFERDRDIND